MLDQSVRTCKYYHYSPEVLQTRVFCQEVQKPGDAAGSEGPA